MNHYFEDSVENRIKRRMSGIRWQTFHIDPLLLLTLLALASLGILILYSASNQNMAVVERQMMRMAIAFGMMFIFAQVPPHRYAQWAPIVYFAALVLLVATLIIGHVDQGARRWIGFGPFNVQPSEIMKLAMPMMMARFLGSQGLPPNFKTILVSFLLLGLPVLLTAKQPDLGTAIIIACSGFMVLLLGGLSFRVIATLAVSAGALMPILWQFLHTYQKERVLTLLNPERDPLGSGYHIIQSKIAIGSGGLLGKGWLNGTQSHLSFLPAHTTDFIFAVSAEELGFIGCLVLIAALSAVFTRCLIMSSQAQSTFNRLVAGSLCLTFMLSALVNIGMVVGLLPVVGIPLPLVSYGGSSMVTTMIGFGIIMSIHTHRKLWSS